MSRRRMALLAVVSVFAVAIAGACADDTSATPCSDIPAGGCPLARGLSCSDPACAAVYACRPGNVWELDHLCPPHEAGAAKDANVPDASVSFDAAIDAPPGAYGGPGCGLLQAPDCALGVVLSCATSCCGCEDLFVCENGGWTLWGSCGDGGIRQR